VMYGAAPDPGVRYRYHRIACGDWWVEDPRSPYYNRFHHLPCERRPPFRVTDGDLSRSPTASDSSAWGSSATSQRRRPWFRSPGMA
jgi:hypothetical protein